MLHLIYMRKPRCRQFIQVLLFLLISYQCRTQTAPHNYFNDFQDFIYKKPNADSALLCLQEMARSKLYAANLGMYVHDVFAQNFNIDTSNHDAGYVKAATSQKNISLEILRRAMLDTNAFLRKTLRPLHLLVQVQEGKDRMRMEQSATVVLNELMNPDDFYRNKSARYALMLYGLMKETQASQPLSQKLFDAVYTRLRSGQIVPNENSTRSELDKRAWYRYMFAAANFIKANETAGGKEKEEYLKTAFAFSPDIADQNRRSAFFYDQFFLFREGKESFKEDYVAFIEHSKEDRSALLSALLEMALTEPGYKPKLQQVYNAGNPGGDFKKYWYNAVHASGTDAPPVLLTQMDKKPFSSKAQGKWVFMDFWGTWCGPCRQEHPQLQKFYDSVISTHTDQISLLTIACRDTETLVKDYMKEKKFSFPVAMSDNRIEETYRIQGYPTKILITPGNHYIVVPFGVDWVSFVKAYAGL